MSKDKNNDNQSLATTLKVVSHIAWSKGLLCIMVLAPLLWGLLPLGYTHIKHDELIKANPMFIVFMRMICSFGASVVLGAIGVLFLRKKYPKMMALIRGMLSLNAMRSSAWFLIGLAFFYFGARALEMTTILGFNYEDEKGKVLLEKSGDRAELYEAKPGYEESYDTIRSEHDYLVGESSLCKGEQEIEGKTGDWPYKISSALAARASTNALREFGYFMGLLLALLFLVKNWWLYGWLARWTQKRRYKELSEKFNGLKGVPRSFLGWMSWAITAFLILASGMLNLASREPLYVWNGVLPMLGLALLVALCTSLSSDCKCAGKLTIDLEELKFNEREISYYERPKAVISCMVMNAFMSGGAALCALVAWLAGVGRGSSVGVFPSLSASFFHGSRLISFGVVIVILCSVVAPVLQLYGVQEHDKSLAKKNMTGHGISGGEWLQICGGCEPLFVVLIGAVLAWGVSICPKLVTFQSSRYPFVSYALIVVSVLTVGVIVLLRIMEMWAEKNSILRNYIFTRVRGSSRGAVKMLDMRQEEINSDRLANLRSRALNLAVFKLFDKRNSLIGERVRFQEIPDDDLLEICQHRAVANSGMPLDRSFFFVIEGCDSYFTQDDPFTHDVLFSIFDWLRIEQRAKGNKIDIDSFAYRFRDLCDDDNPWKTKKGSDKVGLKNLACATFRKATPFVLIVNSTDSQDQSTLQTVKSDVFASLRQFLNDISDIVSRHELPAMVNGIMLAELARNKD
jgi:hypothetical protein